MHFRFASFAWGGVEVPAIVICGKGQDEVLNVATLALAHFEIRGPKEPASIKFSRDADETISFVYEFGEIGKISISDIEEDVLNKIEAGFAGSGLILVLLAVDDAEFNFISTKTFSAVHTEVQIEDEVIYAPRSVVKNMTSLLDEIDSSVDKLE